MSFGLFALYRKNISQYSVSECQCKLHPQKDIPLPHILTAATYVSDLAKCNISEQERPCYEEKRIIPKGADKVESKERHEHSRHPAADTFKSRYLTENTRNTPPRQQHEDEISERYAKHYGIFFQYGYKTRPYVSISYFQLLY